jgi:mRNA interferase HigB
VRVIARRALREFWQRHPDAEMSLRAWFKEATDAVWETPADIKARYPSASLLPRNRVVFNIRGNRYRLVVAVRYDLGIVFIRFVGTHADYDATDVSTV